TTLFPYTTLFRSFKLTYRQFYERLDRNFYGFSHVYTSADGKVHKSAKTIIDVFISTYLGSTYRGHRILDRFWRVGSAGIGWYTSRFFIMIKALLKQNRGIGNPSCCIKLFREIISYF